MSYHRWYKSLLLCLRDIFQVLINFFLFTDFTVLTVRHWQYCSGYIVMQGKHLAWVQPLGGAGGQICLFFFFWLGGCADFLVSVLPCVRFSVREGLADMEGDDMEIRKRTSTVIRMRIADGVKRKKTSVNIVLLFFPPLHSCLPAHLPFLFHYFPFLFLRHLLFTKYFFIFQESRAGRGTWEVSFLFFSFHFSQQLTRWNPCFQTALKVKQ